jgi:hypothetical protein
VDPAADATAPIFSGAQLSGQIRFYEEQVRHLEVPDAARRLFDAQLSYTDAIRTTCCSAHHCLQGDERRVGDNRGRRRQ